MHYGYSSSIALDIEKIFAVEAKERQGQRNDLNIPQLFAECSKGEAAEQAAAAVNTNKQYVKDAKKLEKDALDLLEKVRSGEIILSQAKQELKKRQLITRRMNICSHL